MESWADLAMVAHELGGALAPTRNALDLMRSGSPGSLTPDQDRLLAIASRGLERADRVLQNLSSIAMLEEREPRAEPAVPGDLLQRLLDDSRLEAEARRISMRLEVQEDLDPFPVDPFGLEQVLGNLMSNALKFTPEGGEVSVRAARVRGAVLPGRLALLAGGFGFKPAFLTIRLDDTGVGLSDETRRRLFQPFFRGPEAQQTPGMGLGLAVARRLVRRMCGDLRAESRERGTSFVLTLPADDRTRRLIARIDAATAELRERLALAPQSFAVLRLSTPDLPGGGAIAAALRERLLDARCRVVPLSDTTWVAWADAPVRRFVPALAAALHATGGRDRVHVQVRQAARGTWADQLLLQAVVRCRRPLPAVPGSRGVSHGSDPRRG